MSVKVAAPNLTKAKRKARFGITTKVRGKWEQSRFKNVIGYFRDNKDLALIGALVIQLRHLENQIINNLVEREIEDPNKNYCIRDEVLESVSCWSEQLGIMSNILLHIRDRTWVAFDKADIKSEEID